LPCQARRNRTRSPPTPTRERSVPNELVAEEDEAVANGLGVDEAHRLLVAGLVEEALAGPEHDGEDDQPQLVHQVVLDQRAPELIAGGDDDVSLELVLQLRDLAHHVALEDDRVAPVGILDRRRHDVLGHAVQPVRERAAPGSPAHPEELVASPAEQPRLGAQRLLERDLVPRCQILAPELPEPAAELEALLAVRILDHSVERHVLRAAHDDLSHLRAPLVCVRQLRRSRPAKLSGEFPFAPTS
jgi:hypothetical protein